ncbi:MAG: nucleoside kinase [Kiritimatiellae bacterium]|nr:nucleoside kinase [Kiritimatiellia bacterium]
MTSEELNMYIAAGAVNEVIRVAEAKQVKYLSRIADEICDRRGARLVLVTGASAAGKTTTAKRLCTQLLVNDRPAAINISTDDYFVGDDLTPRDENGELDYEHVECVDIRQLADDMNALMRCEPVKRRRFDFVNHRPVFTDELISVPEGGMIVLEGIHALNPRLTEGIDDAVKFRVFIEPRPNLDVFGGITPSPSDARFLRRMVRDHQFRKRSPIETVRLWPKVRAGEAKWIDPFRAGADAAFNSYLTYELAALKFYVGGLLERCRLELGEDRQVMNMIRLLNAVDPISPEAIPGDSILRETIGGSQLEY